MFLSKCTRPGFIKRTYKAARTDEKILSQCFTLFTNAEIMDKFNLFFLNVFIFSYKQVFSYNQKYNFYMKTYDHHKAYSIQVLN